MIARIVTDLMQSILPFAGADGCRRGWIFVYQIDDKLDAMFATTVREALNRLPSEIVLAIDIPIGLPRSGDRPCCRQARMLLQARRSSVFPVPVRACIDARTHDEAKEMHYRADGRRISAQAWAILPKIGEVDELLRSDHSLRRRIYEMHPEVSFCRWRGAPMNYPKKKTPGYEEREALIDTVWPGERVRLWDKVRRGVGRDDFNDAFAAPWTARRITNGTAVNLTSPEHDQEGLPMRIVR
jgi:predicted RNase H-like nuclease